MKTSYRILFVTFMLTAVLLSACGAGAVEGAGSKVLADVIVTGTIESINGPQWVVNGKSITVDPAVVRDGPFQVGDAVKVEGNVQADGTLVVTRVEAPTPLNLENANQNTNGAFEDNSNNSNINNGNVNDSNGNTNENINDDNSNNANINGSDDLNDNSNDSSVGNTNDDHSVDRDSNDHQDGQGGSGGADDGGSHDSNDDHSGG